MIFYVCQQYEYAVLNEWFEMHKKIRKVRKNDNKKKKKTK